LEIVEIELDLIEDAPRPVPLGREQAAAVHESASGATRDGPEDMQVGQQRLRPRGVRSQARRRGLVGQVEHQ